MLIKICCLFHFLFPIWSPSLRCCLSGSPTEGRYLFLQDTVERKYKSAEVNPGGGTGSNSRGDFLVWGFREVGHWVLTIVTRQVIQKKKKVREEKVISPSPAHSNFWNTGRAFRSQQITCPSATSRNEKGVIHTVTVQRMAGLGMAPSKTGDRPPHAIK